MKFVVPGGAGLMGLLAVRDLVEFGVKAPGVTPCHVVIADYDFKKAKALADSYGLPDHVTAAHLDVRDVRGAAKLFEGATAVVNCVNYGYNLKVMAAALAARSHYVDLGGLFHTTRKQLELHDCFEAADLLALLGMGVAPGTSNILARIGADQLEQVTEIHVRLAYSDETEYSFRPLLYTSYSLQTILQELSIQPAVFVGGQWVFAEPRSGRGPFLFPPPLNLVQGLIYTLHSEVATLPLTFKDKGIQNVSFKLQFDPEFLEEVERLLQSGRPIDEIAREVATQGSPVRVGPYKEHEVIRVVVKGVEAGGKKVTWLVDFHSDGVPAWDIGVDADTGCPPAIAALMIGAGLIKGRGVLSPEVAVPPDLFVTELAKRGMTVTKERLEGWDFEV